MFRIKELKDKIEITKTTVECPVKGCKEIVERESRMARDNSEDAVSWNVFRFLERNNLIEGFLSSITGLYLNSSEVIYWSYSQKEDNVLSKLNEARREFGEVIRKGIMAVK